MLHLHFGKDWGEEDEVTIKTPNLYEPYWEILIRFSDGEEAIYRTNRPILVEYKNWKPIAIKID